jgi:hypothetical protein
MPLFKSAGAADRRTEQSLVWMLGSPRTGSTWLLNLLRASEQVVTSDEPGIGYHLGLFTADVMGPHPPEFDRARMVLPQSRAGDPNYFFAAEYESTWREPLRRLVLERFAAQLARATTNGAPVLVIKEPAGSQAAPFLFTLLPESRLLFLLRDGRDVVDSELDAVSRGAWLSEMFSTRGEVTSEERLGFLRAQSHRWVHRTELLLEVFDQLPDAQRLLVRYEELLAETVAQTARILSWLTVEFDRDRLAAHVDRLSFAGLSAEQKGLGKFARAATPGAWQRNLSAAEQGVVEEIMGETLSRAGYQRSAAS